MYQDVKKHIKQFDSGHFKVEHFEMSEKVVEQEKFRAMIRGSYGEVHTLKAGKYIKLVDIEKHEIVMSDTPMELETNRDFVNAAKGSVFIGGLGLGIVLLAIQKKKEVKRIVVCENELELIEKIGGVLPLNKKVEIVFSDVFKFETADRFDTIYFDIWNTISSDNYEEMKQLHRRFRKNLIKGGWLGSWRFDDCKRMKYAENREV